MGVTQFLTLRSHEALWCVCHLTRTCLSGFVWQCRYKNLLLQQAPFEKITYLREGEPTAGSLVVFIGALELKVLPPNPPQHSSQLLLQLQFPARRKNQVVESTRTAQRTEELSHSRWTGFGLLRKLVWADVFNTKL